MTPLPRATCPVCGREVAVRNNGTLREHWSAPTPNRSGICKGSGNHGGAPVEINGERL